MQEQFLTEEQFFEISRMTESTSTQSDDLDDKSLSRQNELLKSRLKLLEFVVSFLRHKVMDLSRALASSEATREVLRAEEVERQQKFNRDWITLQKMESEKIKLEHQREKEQLARAALEANQRSLQSELSQREEENRALSLRVAVLEASLLCPSSNKEHDSSTLSSAASSSSLPSFISNNLDAVNFDASSEGHSLISRPAMGAVLVETDTDESTTPIEKVDDFPTNGIVENFSSERPIRPVFPIVFRALVALRRMVAFTVSSFQLVLNFISEFVSHSFEAIKSSLRRMSIMCISYVAWVVSVVMIRAKFEEEDSPPKDPPQKTNPVDIFSRQQP